MNKCVNYARTKFALAAGRSVTMCECLKIDVNRSDTVVDHCFRVQNHKHMLKRLCSLSWITRTKTFPRNVENKSMLRKHGDGCSFHLSCFVCDNVTAILQSGWKFPQCRNIQYRKISTKQLHLQYFVEQEKRKVGMSDDTDKSETKKIRVQVEIPLSCITNPTPTPSDIEVLARLFPNENRFLLEMILQGCYGNLLHAIQVISRSSSTSSGTSTSVISTPPQNPTTVPSTSSRGAPLLNYGATYRYLYPGFVPPSYMLPGSPGMGYYRPYFPNQATPSNPPQLYGSTSSESTGNRDLPTPGN